MLELGEEVLDPPALFVDYAIMAVLIFAIAPRRNDWLAAFAVDEIMQAVSIIGAVGQNLAGHYA